MAESPNMDPNLGTREEDWPEVDVDSDTEEGGEAMRRAEAALHATIERSICQRHAQLDHDTIPQALYVKAQNHQDQLTQEERRLLLSRGDIVGKALADPDFLTADETHQILFWPPPDVVRANIQRATGGSLSTPSELYAKGKDAVDHGQFGTVLNDDEIALLARSFHGMDDATFSPVERSRAFGVPGTAQAVELLSRRLGLDVVVFRAAAVHHMQYMAPMFASLGPVQSPPMPGPAFTTPQGQFGNRQQPQDIIRAMVSLSEQHELGNVTDEEVVARNRDYLAALQAASSQSGRPAPTLLTSPWPATPPILPTDRVGCGPWSLTAQPRSPINVFHNDMHLSGYDVEPGWSALSEDQNEAYRARSETFRREAWAEHERALADGTSPFVFPSRQTRPVRINMMRGADHEPSGHET